MATKKVILDGNVIIDLSDTTATADKVANGYKFYDANGNAQFGNASIGQGGGSNVNLSNVQNKMYELLKSSDDNQFMLNTYYKQIGENNGFWVCEGWSVKELFDYDHILSYRESKSCNFNDNGIFWSGQVGAEISSFYKFANGRFTCPLEIKVYNANKELVQSAENISEESQYSYTFEVVDTDEVPADRTAYCTAWRQLNGKDFDPEDAGDIKLYRLTFIEEEKDKE